MPGIWDTLKTLGKGAVDFLESDPGKVLIGLGGAALGAMNPGGDPQKQGYQGGIPQYTAQRTRLPVSDVGRRPGSTGRRYFSDVQYGLGALPAAPAAPPPPSASVAPGPRAPVSTQGGIASALSGGIDTQGVMTDRGITGAKTGTVLQSGPWKDLALSKGETPVEAWYRVNKDQDWAKKGDATAQRNWALFADNRGIAPAQLAAAMGRDPKEVQSWFDQYVGTRMARGGRVQRYAQGGIASVQNGYYLGGATDGMADQIPASIDGQEEAALSHGEFVWPADVVSHLGNGNSEAGAKVLYDAMNRIRKARTGTTQQGKRIDPNKLMPA